MDNQSCFHCKRAIKNGDQRYFRMDSGVMLSPPQRPGWLIRIQHQSKEAFISAKENALQNGVSEEVIDSLEKRDEIMRGFALHGECVVPFFSSVYTPEKLEAITPK